ncbi:sensor histidine kinase [Microbacterium sp. gxy059]|uniref:sensor histidine kinase n=1 Tax=Microbacterium sp. gxy059 TaxID=2957199 RepID=UPI003D95A22D
MAESRRRSFDEYVVPHVLYRSTAGDVLTAVLFIIFGFAMWSLDVGFVQDPDPALPLGTPVVVGGMIVLSAALGLFKRRAPAVVVAILGVVVVAMPLLVSPGLPLVPVIALIDAGYAAMLEGRRRERIAVTVLLVATVAAFVAVLPLDGPGQVVAIGLPLLMMLGLPVAWGTAVRQRDELVEVERDRADALALAAAAQREAAVRAERGEVAAQLHDEVAARLAAISLQAGALAAAADDDEDPRRSRAVAAMRAASHEALEELHRLIGVLAEDRDDDASETSAADPRDALRAQAEAFGAEVRVEGDPGPLPGSVATALTRIAREAVANAARHAPGLPVRATFGFADGSVTMTIENPLPDEAAGAPGSGLGTALMAERWRALGGSGSIGPAGEGRWRVEASLPVPERKDDR